MEYKITYVDTNESFTCLEDEALLSAMKRSHVGPIQHGCGGGGCGVCKIQVISGDYIAFKKMSKAHVDEADKLKNIVLACCIKAQSNLQIKKV